MLNQLSISGTDIVTMQLPSGPHKRLIHDSSGERDEKGEGLRALDGEPKKPYLFREPLILGTRQSEVLQGQLDL